MAKVWSALTLVLLWSASSAVAQTDVPAGLLPISALTWNAAGSPYRIADGDVHVPDGYQLTIEAGVQVELGPSINLHGSLDAQGTSSAAVTFKRLDAGTPWGTLILPAGITSDFVHIGLHGAVTGIQSTADSFSINNSVFTDNVIDVLINAGHANITGSRFEGSSLYPQSTPTTGIASSAGGRLSLINSVITDKTGRGVLITVASGSAAGGIHQATFVRNTTGIHITSDDMSAFAPDIRNVIVTDGDVGIAVAGPGGSFVVPVAYSNLWANQTRDYDPAVQLGAGMMFEDPLFVSSDNLRLSPLSPCIDTGADLTGITTIDLNGTSRPQAAGWDMGAYEAVTVGPTCGNGVVEAAEQCDDGNVSNSDACTNGCAAAVCGDSFIRRTVEECDDGNQINGDGCSATCERSDAGPGPTPKDGRSGSGCTLGKAPLSRGLPVWLVLVGAMLASRRRRVR